MLHFHKHHSDILGEEIAEILAEISAAHKLVSTEEPSHLSDHENKIEGREAILFFLNNYSKITSMPHSISADSCRIDPETGQVC